MLEILFGAEGETLRTFSTVLDEITIGSGNCDLRLPSTGVAAIHCRLRRDDTKWIASPEAPTTINGIEILGPTYLGATDQLQIGPIALQLKPVLREADEQALLDGARDDLAARAVYADWLEERGQWDRAEFLRLMVAAVDLTPGDPRFAETTTRIQKLARCLDPGWRTQLASSQVEGCTQLRREFTCNMTWDRLTPTHDPFVRSCGACSSAVHYCQTEREAEVHARDGHCIVLDVAVDRLAIRQPRPPTADHDGPTAVPGMYMPPSYITQSERPCLRCNGIIPSGSRFCPHCGSAS